MAALVGGDGGEDPSAVPLGPAGEGLIAPPVGQRPVHKLLELAAVDGRGRPQAGHVVLLARHGSAWRGGGGHGGQGRRGLPDGGGRGRLRRQDDGAVGAGLRHDPPPHPLEGLLITLAGKMLLFHGQRLLTI